MKEEFILKGQKFEAEINESKNSQSSVFSGKYEIIIQKNGKFAAGIKPSFRVLNGEELPHKILLVESEFRGIGLASWILDKTKDLEDMIDTECFTDRLGLLELYSKFGYKLNRTVWDEINEVDCCLIFKK